MPDRRPERPTRPPSAGAARAASDRQAREVERLKQENEQLRKQLAEQAKRIADLERQLALRQQNSTTTSKPPSSDGLAGRQRVRGRRGKSRRPAGGQPGHAGHHRPLVPLERVDAIVDLVPDTCRQCAHPLRPRHGVGDPRRHQITELPPIEAHITEYRCHRRRCPVCDTTTLAALPDDLAGQFGPQLTALIAYLTVVCREALALQKQLFRLWHRFRGDPHTRGAPLTRAQLIARVWPIEKQFFALAERHINAADGDVANLAHALFVHHRHFFTFVHAEGVDPTNNARSARLFVGSTPS